MSDRTKLPKGWRLDTFPKNDGAGVVWVLFQALDDGRMCAVAGRDADSEGEAVEAARKVAEASSTPPAPPAWMVEVAREGAAQFWEKERDYTLAAGYRAGCRDDAVGFGAAISTLRLALERKHVVEPRKWTEEELLKAAREDAAQVNEKRYPGIAVSMREGERDDDYEVQAALQARRNMLREGAVAGAAAPVRDRDGNPPAYAPGDRVQKCTGDYRISGTVRGTILNGAGLWRYAVEHQAEGGGAFLHIYAAANLSSTLPTREMGCLVPQAAPSTTGGLT